MINTRTRLILFGTIIFFSCQNSTPTKNTSVTPTLISETVFSEKTTQKNAENIIKVKTHLKDTIIIKGNFALFLRPDDARFESYANNSDAIYIEDSDFDIHVSATMDCIENNERYKDIHTSISDNRYIVVKDCKNGPRVIDRDTINYGLILSGKGKDITIKTFIHSKDYLDMVDGYFNIKNGRQAGTFH